ncbi:hypothetical protein P3X46_027849 [Hevea brasiliensis]|uniref:Uncharacterized protein n=1 Tax=Hevea brasiliensis TaxID=3981 RepID=A0ABQ9L3Q1_HEVBR|nr:hypothetical protein P3X46_027849 [Hevea brasiliensis]
MASQEDDRLLNAGLEGFSTLDERPKRKAVAGGERARRPNDKNNNNQGNELAPAINSKEAARLYGGVLIEPVITSDKAAMRYGGVVIGTPITSDQAAQRYGGILIPGRRKNGLVSGA